MEPKKEGLNLKLCSILLKLQILSINILLNLAFILGIKNNTNDKNIIITDIIKNLKLKMEKMEVAIVALVNLEKTFI